MKRDFTALADAPFDLLVIGGGVYGAWTALDASLRGLRAALVEREDWAAGTSSASSKLIHGGLRYLETLQLGMVRESLAERRLLLRLAPHRVRPLTFAAPIYSGARLGRLRLGIGLAIYDRLARSEDAARRHRRWRRSEFQRQFGFLSRGGLHGGFTFTDAVTDDARFTLELVTAAVAGGAVAVNHAPALRLIEQGGRVAGAVIEDGETGETVEVHAALTVNATGAWAARLEGGGEEFSGVRHTLGTHLIMPPLPTDHALLLTARRDGRVLFLIPWYGRTLLGTTDQPFTGDPGEAEAVDADIDYLLEEANHALGEIRWDRSAILGRFAGVRTFAPQRTRRTSALSREWRLLASRPGLMTPVGGKLTAARLHAVATVNRALSELGRPASGDVTCDRPFPWKPEEEIESWLADNARRGKASGLDSATTAAASLRFGTSFSELLALLREQPEWAWRLHPDLPFCRAEVVHAVRHEMARTLKDILRRRIPIAVLAPARDRTLLAAAALAGQELGWSQERRAREVASLVGDMRLAPV